MRRLLLLLLFPCTCLAGPAPNEPTVLAFTMGIGSKSSCGQFIAAIEGHKLNVSTQLQQNGITFWNEGAVFMQYALGVLTGVNLSRDQDHQITNDNAAIELWLRNWCTKNPTEPFLDAVSLFAQSTLRKNAR